MIPWILLDKASTPGNGKELRLYRRDTEYSIKVGTYELMNSRAHASEDVLAKLACVKISSHMKPQILIGGLGMGFTLRSALDNLNVRAHVTVAELIPDVVKWNRNVLAHLAGRPLDDTRVIVYDGDVADKINVVQDFYHAVLLDVDNGAQGLMQKENDRLYTLKGLRAAYAALKPAGILAIWSAGPDEAFMNLLRKAKFKVEEKRVPTRSGRKGGGHSIVWLAMK